MRGRRKERGLSFFFCPSAKKENEELKSQRVLHYLFFIAFFLADLFFLFNHVLFNNDVSSRNMTDRYGIMLLKSLK